MTINIFEWEKEGGERSLHYFVKAGHLTIEIDESCQIGVDAPYNTTSGVKARIEYEGIETEFTVTDEWQEGLEAIKYIAIGINAEIEAQRAKDMLNKTGKSDE